MAATLAHQVGFFRGDCMRTVNRRFRWSVFLRVCIATAGIADIRNNMSGFVVVRAETHDAAARMFEGHPHFTLFPGDGVEIMECMPIPGR